MNKWTSDQNSAINLRGTDMLVSASAGSGKTTIMIERIRSIIEKGEASIGEILVLTFTNESARDMKSKLAKRLGYSPELTMSDIGTFHKFCGDLVRTYFNSCAINPDFTILDNLNAKIIQNEILEKIIDEQYTNCADAIDAFCPNADTRPLREIILSINEFLHSQADPEHWLNTTAFAGYNDNLSDNIAMHGIITHFNEAGKYYSKKLSDISECFEWALKLSNVKTYTDIHNIAISFDKLARIKITAAEEEKMHKAGLNEILKKIKDQYRLTESQMQTNQRSDCKLVKQVIMLVRLFRTIYTSKKTDNSFLDFSDLERYALEILTNKQLNQNIRRKYKYIFVDEYQDTNPVQERILKLLTSLGNDIRIFVVGDVKQSIYGFRGTESKLFTDRMKTYQKSDKTGKVVKLNANFRSHPGILAFVNEIFERIMRTPICGIDYLNTSRFDISQDAYKKIKDSVEVIIIDKCNAKANEVLKAEATLIAEKISVFKSGGMALGDIANLARSRTHFKILIDILNQSGIPCITDAKKHTGDIYELALLNNMLLSCSNSDKLASALLMQSFIFNFSPNDIAQIHLNKIDTKLSKRLHDFRAFQDKYRMLCQTQTVTEVLTAFITEYKIIAMLLTTPDGKRMVYNIYTFLNKLRFAPYAQTVQQYLHLFENNLIDIEIETQADSTQCVKLMTIHSSKGLEFPIVFLFEAGASFSSAEKRKLLMPDKTCGLCIYSTDPDEFAKHSSIARLGAVALADRNRTAEEMRLLYVALTRPKQEPGKQNKLIIIGSADASWFEDTNIPDDYEILCARSYLHMMKPAIAGSDFLNITRMDDIKIIPWFSEPRSFSAKPDDNIVKQMQEAFGRAYQYIKNINTPARLSVSAIIKSDTHRSPNITLSGHGKDFGIDFHKAMLNKPESSESTKKCEAIVNELTEGMIVYKEIPFIHKTSNTIIHGIVDLLAINNSHAIVVDYKTTIATPPELIKHYKQQLEFYRTAVKAATGLDSKVYIYSTHHEKLILVE